MSTSGYSWRLDETNYCPCDSCSDNAACKENPKPCKWFRDYLNGDTERMRRINYRRHEIEQCRKKR